MFLSKLYKPTLMALLTMLFILSSQETCLALNIKPKTDFNITTTVNKQSDNLNLPTSIIVAPIVIPSDLVIQNSEWYEGLYYYMANRLNQGDFLAHYFVSKEGQIFEGNSKGDEQKLNINDPEDNNPILIIYLTDKGQSDFSINAKTTLAELILDVANRNAIKLSNVQVRSIKFVLFPEAPLEIIPEQISGLFEISLKDIIAGITPKYAPITKQYAVEIVKLDLPAAAVDYGDPVRLKITLKNNSKHILYQGTDYEPILAKAEGSESKFFLNKTWLSQSQTAVMSERSFIKPQETKEFEFLVNVPLYFGTQSETFHLENALGQAYPNSETTMTLEINRPQFKVVEITNTGTGQLNVRDGPWASSSVISRVTVGQRFPVLEETSSGYTKLDLGSGKTGWVVSRYTKSV